MDGNSPEQGQPTPEGPKIPKQPSKEQHSAEVLPQGVDNTPPTEDKPTSKEQPTDELTDTPQGEGIASLPGQLGKGDNLDDQPDDTIADVAKEMPESPASDEEPVVLGAPEPRGSGHDETSDDQPGSGSVMEADEPAKNNEPALPTQQGGTVSGYQVVDPNNPPDEKLQDEIGIPGDRLPESGGDRITPPVEPIPPQVKDVPLGPEEPVTPGALDDPAAVLPQPRVPQEEEDKGIDQAEENFGSLRKKVEENVTASNEDTETPADDDNETHGLETPSTDKPNVTASGTDFATNLRAKLTAQTPGQGDEEQSNGDDQKTDQPENAIDEAPTPSPAAKQSFLDRLLGALGGSAPKPAEGEKTPPDTAEPKVPEESNDGGSEPNGNDSGTPPPTAQ